jgi:hypothetical protein
MPKLREQLRAKGLPEDDETAVLWAMFPQQLETLLKPKPAVATPLPAEAPKAAPSPALPTSASAPATATSTPSTLTNQGAQTRHFAITVNGVRRQVTVQEV